MNEDYEGYHRENLERYYEDQGMGIIDEPQEEPSYGLCDHCINNNENRKCLKSGFPIKMCFRKRKCKHYKQWVWRAER